MKIWPAIFALMILASVARAQEQVDFEKEFGRLCFFDHLFSEEEVGPDFSLKISFRNAPVSGARIELEHDGKVEATARTDFHGLARFSAIRPGQYNPQAADGLVFPVGSLVIMVKAGHASGEKVKLDWPSYPLAVRNLRGRFTTSEGLDSPEIPLRIAIVELREVHTARLIESRATDANGDFEFATSDPGIYALRVVLPKKNKPGTETRDLAIELGPTAKVYSIPEMNVVQSECAGVQLLRRSATDDGWEEQ